MPEILNPGDFQRESLERPRDHGREKVDDQDLQYNRDKAEGQQTLVMYIERAGEVAHRRYDEELPAFAELRREPGQAGDVLPSLMREREQAIVPARSRAESDRRKIVRQGGNVLQLDLTVVIAVSPGAFRVGDHAAISVENIAESARADLMGGEVFGKPVQRDIGGDHARDPISRRKRRGDREPDQVHYREHLRIGDDERSLFRRLFVPEPLPRVVARRLLGCPEFRPRQIEKRVMIERGGRSARRSDPAIREFRAIWRNDSVDFGVWGKLPRLPERPVGEPGIGGGYRPAVPQHAQQV